MSWVNSVLRQFLANGPIFLPQLTLSSARNRIKLVSCWLEAAKCFFFAAAHQEPIVITPPHHFFWEMVEANNGSSFLTSTISFTFRLVLHLSEVLSIINLIETFLTTFLRFLWWSVRLPRHGAGPRIGDEERRLMHLVPAPAVRLMKRRVLSRPGLKSLMLAWSDSRG